jgi:formylmethanofuran dehydrogenase subunit E
MKIGKYEADEYLKIAKEFHGYDMPGLIVGGFMVDLALKNPPEGEVFDFLCETSQCLPDAVQLLTPCTMGNGWLKVAYTSRFAIIIYNKYTGEGARVYIDPAKLDRWKEIKAWYLKEKDKKEQNPKKVFEQLLEAGSDYMSVMKVKVKEAYLAKEKKPKPVAACPSCNEYYLKKFGDKCPACSGNAPYEITK